MGFYLILNSVQVGIWKVSNCLNVTYLFPTLGLDKKYANFATQISTLVPNESWSDYQITYQENMQFHFKSICIKIQRRQ